MVVFLSTRSGDSKVELFSSMFRLVFASGRQIGPPLALVFAPECHRENGHVTRRRATTDTRVNTSIGTIAVQSGVCPRLYCTPSVRATGVA